MRFLVTRTSTDEKDYYMEFNSLEGLRALYTECKYKLIIEFLDHDRGIIEIYDSYRE